jgi:transcriptional regulator with XRE-family HTH domain
MIHRALKAIREFHSVTQTALATQLGISKSYLCEIESGNKKIGYDLLERYSEIFEIPVSSLVFFSESLSEDDRLSEKFRNAVAGKILSIMEWVVHRDASKAKTA